MSAASWQKQLVYEFKELEGLQDAALLEDSQGRLLLACTRLVAELAGADGAHQPLLLVLLRLIPLPALIKRMLWRTQDEPPELSAVDDALFSSTKWFVSSLCTHSSRICAVLAASTALLRAAVPYCAGVQMRALPGVQAAAGAVLQSKALLFVAMLQNSLTDTLPRNNADQLPASVAATLTQVAAHLLQWCSAARVLCASAAGQDYSCEEDTSVNAILASLTWQLATSIGQGSCSSDAAASSSSNVPASSSLGKADSNSSSGRSAAAAAAGFQ